MTQLDFNRQVASDIHRLVELAEAKAWREDEGHCPKDPDKPQDSLCHTECEWRAALAVAQKRIMDLESLAHDLLHALRPDDMDPGFYELVANRFVNVYNENPDADYVVFLRHQARLARAAIEKAAVL